MLIIVLIYIDLGESQCLKPFEQGATAQIWAMKSPLQNAI